MPPFPTPFVFGAPGRVHSHKSSHIQPYVYKGELSGGTGKVPYYEGTPIPTSVIIVALLVVAWWRGAVGHDIWLGRWRAIGGGHFHPLVLLYALSGGLMVSRIRIPKP